MSARRSGRATDRETVLACRTIPLPFVALYGLGAAGVTWLIAAWRDRRHRNRLRDEIRARKEDDGEGEDR